MSRPVLALATVFVIAGQTSCTGVTDDAIGSPRRTPATAPETTGPAISTTVPTTTTTTTTTTTVPTTTTTTTVPTTTTSPVYVFPFVGRVVSYGTTHHDYPAVDVFGCRSTVVAPTSGAVLEVSIVDRWDPAVDDPATRGGKFVSMLGDDGVRYYVAHLGEVAVAPAQRVDPGSALGVMGQTGNARNSECHTHLGIAWACPASEWQVRRGRIWPAPYLDAWKAGEQRSPASEVRQAEEEQPDACDEATALVAGES